MIDLEVQKASRLAGIPAQERFERWVAAALAGRRESAELAIRVADEAEVRALNATYRGRDYATNVLSFPAELPAGVALPMLGDLVICAPVVFQEAAEQGKSVDAHWAHLVVHGVLHLLSYNHIDEGEAEAMEALEREILAGLGYADPYGVA